MEEILALRESLIRGDISGALLLVEEMEEMGLKAIQSKIRSYSIILLLHLIKQAAEQRTTRSWDLSIRNAVLDIQDENERKPGSTYLDRSTLRSILEKAYPRALNTAAKEAFEGRYDADELGAMVDRPALLAKALEAIAPNLPQQNQD